MRKSKIEYLYVLSCENGNYYVGQTNNIEKRKELHEIGEGAKWTKLHKPIDLIKSGRVLLGANKKGNVYSQENALTINLINKYGAEKVRGGDFTKVNLDTHLKELSSSFDLIDGKYVSKLDSNQKKGLICAESFLEFYDLEKSYFYIVALEDNHFYYSVKKGKNLLKEIKDLFHKNHSSKNIMSVKKPLNLIHLEELSANSSQSEQDQVALPFMQEFGAENFRGGSFLDKDEEVYMKTLRKKYPNLYEETISRKELGISREEECDIISESLNRKIEKSVRLIEGFNNRIHLLFNKDEDFAVESFTDLIELISNTSVNKILLIKLLDKIMKLRTLKTDENLEQNEINSRKYHPRAYEVWSDFEVKILKNLYFMDMHPSLIAFLLKRSEGTIMSKIEKLRKFIWMEN
tara:strand:- start:1528 stop:2742 length:1215 start_codon:yes stop_codon:yes gene_type:complete